MNTARRIAKLLVICCICTVMSPAEHAKEPDMIDEPGVRMEITKLEVNESALALSYKIENGTDREAWVCNAIGRIPFEAFLASDKQTLLVRKRLDVPTTAVWRGLPPVGTYIRVAPGASLADSVQIALPATPAFLYASRGTAEIVHTVTRLALEIGYYDEDLPALIHSIIAVAKMSGLTARDVPANILDTYFKGVRLHGALAAFGFDAANRDPYGRGIVYINYSYQALTGEKILRVDVNDVSVPYKGYSERGAGSSI